jgi:hypothetical protein
MELIEIFLTVMLVIPIEQPSVDVAETSPPPVPAASLVELAISTPARVKK